MTVIEEPICVDFELESLFDPYQQNRPRILARDFRKKMFDFGVSNDEYEWKKHKKEDKDD